MHAHFRDFDRWYWTTVTLLLATGLLGWGPALGLVYLLCAARTVQLAVAGGGLGAFPVQVNVAFLAILVAAAAVAPRLVFCIALLGAGTHALTVSPS